MKTASRLFKKSEKNTLTGVPFVHVRVHTFQGELDIVASHENLEIPSNPQFACASVWLVGRPLDPVLEEPPQRFWRKLLGG